MRTVFLSARSGAALAGIALATAASANIVVFDPADIAIPSGGQGYGYYIDIATGAYGQDFNAPELARPNFQLYRATGTIPTLRFAANNTHPEDAWIGSGITGPFSLDPNEIVGPDASFVKSNGSTGAGAYRQDRTGFLGIRFLNSATGATNYGWMEIVTTTDPAYSATLTRWAYDDSGASIRTGQTAPVPEPASIAALGLGAFAAARRRRRG